VHRQVAPRLLPRVGADLVQAGVELRADPHALAILRDANVDARPATDDDWGTEFLSLAVSIKIVDGLDEALDHLQTYHADHTDAVLTEDPQVAARFVNEVDSAVVLVNASTRFNDGGQLGLGAEVAVSTQKLHARGPMALHALTTYKWVVEGDGQIRT
jgi:glutamate-5-semialdehyde dehydrogenase